MGDNTPFSEVETVLDKHAALPHLQTLVEAGCNRNELLSLMQLAFFANESWKTLVGMDLRAFKQSISQARACADMIDRLNRSELVYHVSIEVPDPRFASIHASPTLSEQLRDYADKLDFLRAMYGPKRAVRRHAWKSWIVAHVIEDTTKPRDLEVSALIAAILDESYSEKAHEAWRRKYGELIKNMRDKLLLHRRKRHLRSATN